VSIQSSPGSAVERSQTSSLADVVGEITESGAKGKSKGALEGGVDKLRELVGSDDDKREREPAGRRRKGGQR